jgi:hypothetical protein
MSSSGWDSDSCRSLRADTHREHLHMLISSSSLSATGSPRLREAVVVVQQHLIAADDVNVGHLRVVEQPLEPARAEHAGHDRVEQSILPVRG